ncbi:MAG TPA: hypothetical protein VJ672_07605 [Gemmatimonadaceae bacterium]|nr:hypothetical protein [Gemmatimonadaceae bacterium]
MRYRILITLALTLFVSPDLFGQSSAKPATPAAPKKSTPSRPKSLVGKLADTAITSAASLATDTILGDKAGMVAAVLGASGEPSCPAGLIAIPASHAMPGAAGAAGMPTMPSAGTAIVGAAKNKLFGKKADAAAAAAGAAGAAGGSTEQAAAGSVIPASGYMCGTPEQVTAAMQTAQAGAGASQGAAMKQGMGAALAATPQGQLAAGAVAAAPVAVAGAKKLGGMFGKGGQTAESMKKDLAKGKLVVKKIKFVKDSDEMAPGFEADIAMLAEALQGSDGQFVLTVPPEGDEAGGELAQKRMERVFAHLLISGLPNGRLMTGQGGKPVKSGDARVEISAAGRTQ